MIPYGKQDITQEDIESVVAILQSDFITQGSAVPEFEQSANYSINPLELHLYIQFKLDTTSTCVYKILKDHPTYSYLHLHVIRLLEFWLYE